jgi:hypothetical protein
MIMDCEVYYLDLMEFETDVLIIDSSVQRVCDVLLKTKTHLRLPWPSFPSSPSPQEYTSPSADRAKQCFPPELTATW